MSTTAVRPTPQVLRTLQYSHQEVLSKTAHLLLADTDPDTLCQTVFEEIRERFRLDVYFHYLVTPDGKGLRLASSGGNEIVRAALGTPLRFGQAVCGTVAATCEAMYVTAVQQRTDEMTSLIRSFGVRCYACNPVYANGQLVGTLSLGSSRRDEFSPDELAVFRLLTQQVSIATERRMQNERLLELERLAAAGRMSAVIAHEINNPLDAIATLLYLLRDEVHSPEGLDLLGKADRQVSRLVDTSHHTLEMFRGKHQAPYRVNLSDLARDLVASIRLPQNARLSCEIEDDLFVEAIPGEMRQVIYNLLINAAQFTPPGKVVTLTVRCADSNVEVRIRDEGPGISAETGSHLFEPFYTTRESGGTGIGLWLSKELVERIHGTLTFLSDPVAHPGTEFIVTLPLKN